MSKINLLVYGALRPGYSNYNHFLVNCKHLGTGKTINKYKMSASGIPFVSKKPLCQIVVDAFEIDDEKDLPGLDRLEGHPVFYKREEIEAEINGENIKGWLYFCEEEGETLVDSGDYTDYRNRKL